MRCLRVWVRVSRHYRCSYPPLALRPCPPLPLPWLQYCYLPIPLIIQAPRRVDPHGELWNRLRSSIGQPNFH